MESSTHLYIWKALKLQKVCPGITERLYNVLLLIKDGYCTSKHIYSATNDLNISGKGWEDVYEICNQLEAHGLINYHRGILKPYRGKTLGVVCCNANGYAFISMIQDRTLKMSKKKLTDADIKAISKSA